MNLKNLTLVAIATLTLTANAMPGKEQIPIPQNSGAAVFTLSRSIGLDGTNNNRRPLNDEKDICYNQEFGGGGVGTAIALAVFGPIGVAQARQLNEEAIKKNTQADADHMFDKIMIKPRDIFSDVVKGQIVAETNGEYLVTPFVYVTKISDGKLLLASGLIVEQREKKWIGRYLYQLPMSYTVDELAHLDAATTEALKVSVADGYVKLLAMLAKDSKEQLDSEKQITFQSNFISPRDDEAMSGHLIGSDNDVTWVRAKSGVYALRKDSFSTVEVLTSRYRG